jgi:hypothetical protein
MLQGAARERGVIILERVKDSSSEENKIGAGIIL